MEFSTLSNGDLLTILDIARRMAEQRLVAPLLHYIATEAIALVGAERCYIVMFQPDGSLFFRLTCDQKGEPIAGAEDQISRSVLERVRQSGSPLLLRDAVADPNFGQARSVRSLNLRSVMSAPLISYGEAIGAIYVENRAVRGRFAEQSLATLVLFAAQAVVAIENAAYSETLEAKVAERTQELRQANTRLEAQASELRQRMAELEHLRDKLHELSIRDSLTGLYNRRYLVEVATQHFEQARRHGRDLAVVMIDLDSFKQINDTYGHSVGDQVLATMATLMLRTFRSSDVVARFGGEEFAIVQPETSLERALAACERLRLALSEFDWSQMSPGLQVTISAGIAANEPGFVGYQDQLRCADDRLLMAKRGGKNRIVIAG